MSVYRTIGPLVYSDVWIFANDLREIISDCISSLSISHYVYQFIITKTRPCNKQIILAAKVKKKIIRKSLVFRGGSNEYPQSMF